MLKYLVKVFEKLVIQDRTTDDEVNGVVPRLHFKFLRDPGITKLLLHLLKAG